MRDEDFVQEVFDASYRRLVAQLYGVCGNRADAEDAVQGAFVRALAGSRRFRETDNPEAWLRTVALNVTRSRWRRAVKYASLEPRLAEATRSPVVNADHVGLVEAMRRLPVEQREAIALHHIGDLPVDEIARTLNVPVGTVKARLSRGRAALAKLLDDTEVEHA